MMEGHLRDEASYIQNEFLNLSMKSLNDSPFSCRMLTTKINIKWCDQLVANYVMNLATKVSSQSIENGGR